MRWKTNERERERESNDNDLPTPTEEKKAESSRLPLLSTHHRPVVGAEQHRRSAAADVALRRLRPGRGGDGVVRSSRRAGGVSTVVSFFVFFLRLSSRFSRVR